MARGPTADREREWRATAGRARGRGLAHPRYTSSFQGSATAGPRQGELAAIWGARGHLALRLAGWDNVPHLVLGGGTETILSRSPYLEDETDWVAYYGVGATVALCDRIEFRFDVRHGIMPGRNDDLSSTLEVQGGLQISFGGTYQQPPRVEAVDREPDVVVIEEPDEPPAPIDTDGDGFVDALDRCPTEPETRNGVEDSDGCPELDPDGDRVFGASDRCPDDPEDVDGFRDADGCPDRDNDDDGLADPVDKCSLEPETRNGFQDEDGCADTVPAPLTSAFALAATVKFEPGRARVTPAGAKVLRQMLATLDAYRDLRFVVVGHPARGDQTGDALAKKRAEAVKWYLVDQGADATHIDTRVGGVARQTVTVELPAAPPAPAP